MNDSAVRDSNAANQAEVLVNIENLIKSHLKEIEDLKTEVKKNSEMVEDVLTNDQVYVEHANKAKEANKLKSATKAQIMKQPNMVQLAQKIKEGRQRAKELELALSEYLREYERLSGTNQIEGENGEVREIVYTAKLVKKTPKSYN